MKNILLTASTILLTTGFACASDQQYEHATPSKPAGLSAITLKNMTASPLLWNKSPPLTPTEFVDPMGIDTPTEREILAKTLSPSEQLASWAPY